MKATTLKEDLEADAERIKKGISNGDYSRSFERWQKVRLKMLLNHIEQLDRIRKYAETAPNEAAA